MGENKRNTVFEEEIWTADQPAQSVYQMQQINNIYILAASAARSFSIRLFLLQLVDINLSKSEWLRG